MIVMDVDGLRITLEELLFINMTNPQKESLKSRRILITYNFSLRFQVERLFLRLGAAVVEVVISRCGGPTEVS